MKITTVSSQVSVSDQIQSNDIATLADLGVTTIICNRPDGEAADQPSVEEITAAANARNIVVVNLPFTAGKMPDSAVLVFREIMGSGQRIHAYCRTGNRSSMIFDAANRSGQSTAPALSPTATQAKPTFDIVIIGAGAGGIAVSASLLKRNKKLRIALIDPSSKHYYQPGWTMVGGGVFSAKSTERRTADLIDHRASLIVSAVTQVVAEESKVVLSDGGEVYYQQLAVAPGLVINWGAIEGLSESLGKYGVTSNYRYDLAPYTWELVQQTTHGKAIFTQPPMPIKCAGAPQKALYLSADHWYKNNTINNIDIDFCNAGGLLFGVAAYVEPLMAYIKKYNAALSFNHNLVKVDGPNKKAWFDVSDSHGNKTRVCKEFDMLHVCPPQHAPDFIRSSGLSDQAGWLDVNPQTLQHKQHSNIWGLGDVMNTTNAKTMAAVRKQVPVVAKNICAAQAAQQPAAHYDGYGSCPLTVERGKIILAEFCYGGRVAPTFPNWLNNGSKPTRLAWLLKAVGLPFVYWNLMLKGHEWFTDCPAEK